MDLIARNSGGYQLVGRPQARPAWYPPDQVRPVRVEVWWRYVGEVAAAARLIGTFAPGQVVTVPLNPVVDRDLIFSTVSISSDGLRSARELADANHQTMIYVRERTAPTIRQIDTATHRQARIAVDNYSRFALKRRLTLASDAGMSEHLEVIEQEIGPGDRVVFLNRGDSDDGTRTIHLAVAHSSGGAYGPDSAPIALTFADINNNGGSSGDGDLFPHRVYDLPGTL